MTTQRSLWQRITCSGQLREQDRKNQWVATGWVFAWSLAFVAASFLLKRDLVTGPLRWAVAILPTVVGIGMVLVYKRFLSQADELQRKIQLDALAIGFGVGVIGSVGLELIQHAGGQVFDVSTVMLPMVATYALAIFSGARRYA